MAEKLIGVSVEYLSQPPIATDHIQTPCMRMPLAVLASAVG